MLRRARIPAAVAVCLATLSLDASRAHATPILDQSFQPGLSASVDLPREGQFAQTFLIGISGLFTGIDLSIVTNQPSGIVQISMLRTLPDGTPADPSLALASILLPGSYWALPGTPDEASYRYVEFMPFEVVEGELIAVYVDAVSGEFTWQGGGTGDPADLRTPTAFRRLNGWTPMEGSDFAFQTYVEPTPAAVPEPASLLLLSAGIFGLIVKRSRRWHA